MQGNHEQQAYDRGITIFSPDGRLYQVEYAREAVERGSPTVGVRTAEGVVLAADRQLRSPLIERESIEKIHSVDNHIGIASAGHVADARQLVDHARQQAQLEQLRYGEEIGVETLTKAVTDHIQQYTQVGGARPFGVALLIGGIEDGQPRLFEADPSGTPYEWQAVAVGGGHASIREHLEEEYDSELDQEAGIKLALEALAAEHDELEPEGVHVSSVTVDDPAFSTVDTDVVAEYVEELGLGGEDDE